jgi:hypothetical protein
MNSANAKVVRYFIVFSMGWTIGTLISQLVMDHQLTGNLYISAVLLGVSTILFITRAYEDEDTKILRASKESSDADYRHRQMEEEKKRYWDKQ